MNPGALIPAQDALKVLLKQYYSGTASQAQLDCLVEHGLLKTDKGAYWATGRAAALAPNTP
jgi:hypothetical protein